MSSLADWAASEVTETSELLLDNPGGIKQLRTRWVHGAPTLPWNSPQHPTPHTSTSLWRELALNLGIILIHLLPLGVFCRVTPQLLWRGTEPSSARGVGPGLSPEPALGCAYLVCRPSALSLGNRSSQLGLLIWGIILKMRVGVNIQPAFFFSFHLSSFECWS